MFVIQPTGSGKSLIFQSAPIVFDTIRPLSNAKWIALVISPLASLMQDQVRYLKSVGIKAEFIGDEQESQHAKQQVEPGECQIVFGSPKAFLSTKRWRQCSVAMTTKRGCVWLQLMKLTAFLTGKSLHLFAFPSVLGHRRRINYIFSITSQTRSTGHASSRLSSGRIKDWIQETVEIEPTSLTVCDNI